MKPSTKERGSAERKTEGELSSKNILNNYLKKNLKGNRLGGLLSSARQPSAGRSSSRNYGDAVELKYASLTQPPAAEQEHQEELRGADVFAQKRRIEQLLQPDGLFFGTLDSPRKRSSRIRRKFLSRPP